MNFIDRIAWHEKYRWQLILYPYILHFIACHRCILPFDISDTFDSVLLARGILGRHAFKSRLTYSHRE